MGTASPMEWNWVIQSVCGFREWHPREGRCHIQVTPPPPLPQAAPPMYPFVSLSNLSRSLQEYKSMESTCFGTMCKGTSTSPSPSTPYQHWTVESAWPTPTAQWTGR
eukprot:PhF_6_TR40803/c0_g1_i1/m.61660